MSTTRSGTIDRLIDPRTVVVTVTRVVRHPKYGKIVRRRRTYLVDRSVSRELSIGQSVVIEAVRPISKRKHWRVVEQPPSSAERQPVGAVEREERR
jgi:small subunit ribosomal protein S17